MMFRVAAIVLLVVLAGCGDGKEAAAPSTKPDAASTEHFVNDLSDRFAPQRATAVAMAPQAPKPTGFLPKDSSCVTVECHAGLVNARHVHGPVAQKDCASCHEDDTGGHKYPLKRDPIATCTHCHKVAGTQSHQHKALEKGCLSCHRPHDSTAKFLLKYDTVERVCADCHQVTMKKFAHDPFAKGECMVCHQAHQADNKKLLRGGDGNDHCFSCHSGFKDKLASSKHRHEPAQKDCNTCHGPHSTDFKHQLKADHNATCTGQCHQPIRDHLAKAAVQHAAMTSVNGCSNCHNSHASNDPGLLRARMDTVCLTCHNAPIKATDGHLIADMRPVLNKAKFLHGPIRSGSCSACHDAHGASKPGLLEKNFPRTFYTNFEQEKYDLCFTCHEKQLVTMEKTASLTGFRSGESNLHFLHVNREEKGRSCKSCHNLHGSDNEKHIASDVSFERSTWALQVGFTKSEQGGSCTPSCHRTRDYQRTLPTTRGSS